MRDGAVFWIGVGAATAGVLALLYTSTHRPYVIASVRDDLRIPSRITPQALDRAFEVIVAPRMVGLGQAFVQAERESGVNAVFLAALAVHESNKGESPIAREKKNLFGWGAIDSNPYDRAYAFHDEEAGIRYVASRIRALYFDEWQLYTLEGMNTRYSTDGNWKYAVLNWIRRLQDAGRD